MYIYIYLHNFEPLSATSGTDWKGPCNAGWMVDNPILKNGPKTQQGTRMDSEIFDFPIPGIPGL